MAMRYDAGAAAYDQLTGRWSQLFAHAALAAVKPEPGTFCLTSLQARPMRPCSPVKSWEVLVPWLVWTFRCRCCVWPVGSLERHMFSS